jgi:DedD protein
MMDRALKERIIGAIVLVLFVVLVVPVFLDGPTNRGEMIIENVSLPGQADQATQTIVLDRDRTEPVPAATNNSLPVNSEPQTRQVVTPVQEKPAPSPPPQQQAEPETVPAQVAASTAPEKRAPAASTTGMWAVQLGSFGEQARAEKLAAELRKQGFAAFLSQFSNSSGELHRVRIGPQKDRESAEAMAGRLQKAGHKGQVVPHP